MLAFPEPVTMVNRARVAQFAAAQRLPSMFGWSEYCEAGGLLSYGANQRATYFLLAKYADRILRGENPAELPVVQPEKFELAVNLKTARLFGEELDLFLHPVPGQQGVRMSLESTGSAKSLSRRIYVRALRLRRSLFFKYFLTLFVAVVLPWRLEPREKHGSATAIRAGI